MIFMVQSAMDFKSRGSAGEEKHQRIVHTKFRLQRCPSAIEPGGLRPPSRHLAENDTSFSETRKNFLSNELGLVSLYAPCKKLLGLQTRDFGPVFDFP